MLLLVVICSLKETKDGVLVTAFPVNEKRRIEGNCLTSKRGCALVTSVPKQLMYLVTKGAKRWCWL